jgi:hypothetical protein
MDHGGHGRIEKRDKMSTFGNVKAHISCNVKCPGITPFSHGFTDAYLDAVGC